ncbi:peptide receptor GPCR [Elysia marginata]|uniref:Peptide receptor GPCR n=1 Tax=Elysia marginata TaxID=1093978 RepID=A0AAV4GH78_9GAST|nr:peptide receptor GPCR [Elysia marginata]
MAAENIIGASANNTVSAPDDVTSTMERIFITGTFIMMWAILITAAFGIVGNILNLIVYSKLGFSETIHMTYVAMAVSDLGCLLTLMWICLVYFSGTILAQSDIQLDIPRVAGFTGSWPHNAFSRTTALLTAWVSLERCVCVMCPTRVKLIITPRVTKIILSAIFIIGCFPVAFVYVGLKTELRLDPTRNQTTLLMYYGNNNALSGPTTFAFSLYGVVYPVASWATVLVCAAFLIAKLKQSARWRHKNTQTISGRGTTGNRQRTAASKREAQVTRTVIAIACVFVFCTLPTSTTVLIATVNREFSITGSLRVIVSFYGIVSFFLSGINSCSNIVVYSFTGSKFKSTLCSLFVKNRSST